MKTIIYARGVSLAKRHLPLIWQGFESLWDIPCKIYLEDLDNFKPDPKPTLYYSVKTDEQNYYILYCFFHPKDWAKFPSSLLPGEVHDCDFEGILLQTPYYLPQHKPKSSAKIITVAHHALLIESYEDDSRPAVVIDSQGHAITPCDPSEIPDSQNYLLLKTFKFINLDKQGTVWWDTIKLEFNKHSVHMPDQWSHNGKYEGWMWTNPDDLFKVMFSEA
jgi:hypothetical protein